MLEIGSTIAGYRIDAVLGRGGMGIVYEATQMSLQRTVALKVLAPHLSEDPAFRRRFQREGSVQARLDHPHIITVYEAGDSDAGLFLAMRLVRGPTLKDMILSRELDAGRALRLLTPIADAIDTAHAARLIHRDIKPQNILVGGRDHAWLADFGLTKTSGETMMTKTGQFVGTLDYISPEQISDYDATQASDIYSLGGVLYEALVGSVPFPKKSEAAVIYAHLATPPPRVTDERPELPAALDDVIAKAMAKEPPARYARASELIRAAAEAFDQRSRAVLRTPPPFEAPEQAGVREPETSVPTEERPRQPGFASPPPVVAAPGRTQRLSKPRRQKPAWVAGAAVALVGIAAAGFAVSSPSSERQEAAGSRATAGPLSLDLPDSWRPLSQRVSVPGLAFPSSLSVEPRDQARSGLILGQLEGAGAALAPARFVSAIGDAKPATVRIGALEGYRYGPATPKGFDRAVTLYAIPTSNGVMAAACFAPERAIRFLATCEHVVSTVRLDAGRAYSVRPSAAYARSLERALEPVRSARRTGPAVLRAARNLRDQAAASSRLGAAYTRAATQVRALDGGPRLHYAQTRLATALDRVAASYRRAGAARTARAYRTAASGVARAGRAVSAATRAFRTLGYQLSSS